MADMMPADQAAKVLRRHNEWRRGADDNHWQESPYSPAELGHAIDAAVAALEELKGARLALSAAKTALAAKDAAYALQSKEWDALQEKARTLDSERQANAILTEENDRLRERLEVAASAVPVAWRYQDANDHYRYRKYVAGFDVEYKSLRPVPLYAAPQPAYCCAKCGLSSHPRERALAQDAARGNFRRSIPAVAITGDDDDSIIIPGA